MSCNDIRPELLRYQRGQLAPEARDRVAAHLATCEACQRAAALEEQLSDVLERRLPQHPAPLALKRRLAARLSVEPEARPALALRAWMRRIAPSLASALAAASLALLCVRAINPAAFHPESPVAQLVAEGVNDHLRIVQSTHPVEIESGGIHQVKPWFTGRLDFAPRIAFSGDDEFPLVGGSVGYYRDRKAAVFIFKHKLHTISLVVFPAEGLAWPTRGLERIGRLNVASRSDRGFSVLLWRDGQLGYCLVSDVDRSELERLAVKVAGDGA
jgi:anti-sigma factor (TIGR02949 family)